MRSRLDCLRFFVDCRPHGYAALRDAFAEGYSSCLPWPERRPGQIDLLVAGRRLRKADWVLLTDPFVSDAGMVTDPTLVADFFAQLEAEFRALLEGRW